MESVENLEILRLTQSVNNGEAVGLRSLDLRLMRSYPAVVQQGQLLARVRELVTRGALAWKQENSSVVITAQGEQLLAEPT